MARSDMLAFPQVSKYPCSLDPAGVSLRKFLGKMTAMRRPFSTLGSHHTIYCARHLWLDGVNPVSSCVVTGDARANLRSSLALMAAACKGAGCRVRLRVQYGIDDERLRK